MDRPSIWVFSVLMLMVIRRTLSIVSKSRDSGKGRLHHTRKGCFPLRSDFLCTHGSLFLKSNWTVQGESGSLGVTLKDDVPSKSRKHHLAKLLYALRLTSSSSYFPGGRYQVNLSYSYLEDPANERSREYVSVDVAQSSYVQEFAETVEADVSHYWNYHPDSEFGSTKGKFSTNPPERRKGERI